ncbi:hypothetical protein OZX67_09100 [Bifidobacterium sp. ESL0728]|uniref:hypothetical protein n=1 Tax=Bifidobacterium sp. ESL0728 TaxID=2983220 RepID=UPI0023F9BD32|nr:hypothetical protein [Bifidobacterium sp. ESL0728]WEV58926.1 hypothetical protein OZX67_09100 [Bifidobacterium sp. ESL0728]
MKRQVLLKRLIALVAAVVLTITGAIVAAKVPASADNPGASSQSGVNTQGVEVGPQANNDWKWQSVNPVHDGASRKPVLYKLLSSNNKIDTLRDELRMDFVVRVAHGEVDPTVRSGYDTGLRIIYDYGNGGNDGNGTLYPNYGHTVGYLNTVYGGNPKSGATQWAENNTEYYTILSVESSAPYDFITVSIEADMDIPNENDGYWRRAGTHGNIWKQHVWALVGPVDRSPIDWGSGSYDWLNAYVSSSLGNNWAGQQAAGINTYLTSGDGAPFATNVATDADQIAYPGICFNGIYNHGCNIPQAWVGFDEWPQLWSDYGNGGGQSNWGLTTDAGLGGDGNVPVNTGPGIAPPNSFFVRWYDPALYDGNMGDICAKVSGFKFQWIGLQNGKNWVPVKDLTPTAKEVDNVPVLGYKPTNGSDFGVDNYDYATGTWNHVGSQPYFTQLSALNAPTHGNNNLMVDGAGTPGSAMKSDGSIDFGKAKADQNLDGYFKLVTWPVVDSRCTATDPLVHPNPSTEGIDATMAATDQTSVQKQIDTGWTVGTAFCKFDVARPKMPTIDKISNDDADTASEEQDFTDFSNESVNPPSESQSDLGDNRNTTETTQTDSSGTSKTIYHEAWSQASKPTIRGSNGVPGDQVHLYYDVPNRSNGAIMVKNTDKDSRANGDDYDKFGTAVGTATVAADGTWSIQDTVPVNHTQKKERVRRYHAYEIDPNDPLHVASHMSDISVANFSSVADPKPTFNAIIAKPDGSHATSDVPHTVLNTSNNTAALPSGSKVKISGTVSSTDGGSSLHIYAKGKTTPSGSSPYGTELTGDSKVSCSIGNTSEGKSATNLPQGTTTWQCTIDPTWFAGNVKTEGDQWTFSAVAQTSDGTQSPAATQSSEVNIFAPKPGMTSADWQGVSGIAVPDNSDAADGGVTEEGATVTVTWPDNTTSTTTINNSSSGKPKGYWHVPLPVGMRKGTVKVKVTDSSTNQSVEEDLSMISQPPLSKLPMTGGFSRWALLLALLVAVIAATAYAVFRKTHSRLVHKGVHAK